jgi:hypothetical protein
MQGRNIQLPSPKALGPDPEPLGSERYEWLMTQPAEDLAPPDPVERDRSSVG